MVQAAQPRLMKCVASFLLASGPTWRSPPQMESRLPHSCLYPSPRRFPVESHLLPGCSHKIPNGTSSALDLPQCSTTTSNTILGLFSQGLSRNVLPHAAPGFFAGRGRKDWWSSLNFASILLASRDDISALCSGRRTQSQGMTILSSGVAMVFSMGVASQGSSAPIYSDGAQRQSPFNSLMVWQPYQDIVHMWCARSLSATGSTDTSAVGLMTPFQSLSFSGDGGISMPGQNLHRYSALVTPDFPKETKCKPICMPRSSFMHIVDITE
jgi:hypothetical protein